ncbi:unnamed protein product [Bursaphelenchus okinawaensis]|uniref:Uncharacterized protein n=1 Tax=Bursaphelenchus okinawaensis TaxID=465554 RepID=A0A811LPG7_9BILA|nr:unnamed protein product [Bursaphelenchus okinawaensis]CAG9127598.1 unnamed protein product [Bursaphelenchus okinawaensis]
MQAHQKPTTYEKKPLKQEQDGVLYQHNDYFGIGKERTFKSYDDLVHAIIQYEMAARVHLLRGSSNFLTANKKVNFSEETCRQFVFDRIVFKCPNHEVTKRFDSQTAARIEQFNPGQVPNYKNVKETVAFRSKNRALRKPNLEAPECQDTDAPIPKYCEDIETLISRYDCIKKPVCQPAEARASNGRGTKRRMADDGGVVAKKVLFPMGQVQSECPETPNQLYEEQASFYCQSRYIYQRAGPSQAYWNQPVSNYDSCYAQTATQQEFGQTTTSNNAYGQPAANTEFFNQNWTQYNTYGQDMYQKSQYYSHGLANPVFEETINQPAYIPPYNEYINNKENVNYANSQYVENNHWSNCSNNYVDSPTEQPLQLPVQEFEAPPLAQDQEIEAAIPPIEEEVVPDENDPPQSPQIYYDEQEMNEVGSGGADLILMALEGLY